MGGARPAERSARGRGRNPGRFSGTGARTDENWQQSHCGKTHRAAGPVCRGPVYPGGVGGGVPRGSGRLAPLRFAAPPHSSAPRARPACLIQTSASHPASEPHQDPFEIVTYNAKEGRRRPAYLSAGEDLISIRVMKAQALLLTPRDIQSALGPRVHVESASPAQQGGPVAGDIIRAAAMDSAYRRFTGDLTTDGTSLPIAVSVMALVFDTLDKVRRMYSQVAQAAHLRTQVQECEVAVETVTAPNGLVSYWGFVHLGKAIVIVTLDTLDPQQLSVADLRSLVTVAARKLETVTSQD